MTTAQAVGAASSEAAEWYAIDWQTIHRNVRRLQVRIVKAVKEGRWNKVRALQRLLTHSYSGKVLAVRRVTENPGKRTPGLDGETWGTPDKKARAIHALRCWMSMGNSHACRSELPLCERREAAVVVVFQG